VAPVALAPVAWRVAREAAPVARVLAVWPDALAAVLAAQEPAVQVPAQAVLVAQVEALATVVSADKALEQAASTPARLDFRALQAARAPTQARQVSPARRRLALVVRAQAQPVPRRVRVVAVHRPVRARAPSLEPVRCLRSLSRNP
jgi:hypothetical protein